MRAGVFTRGVGAHFKFSDLRVLDQTSRSARFFRRNIRSPRLRACCAAALNRLRLAPRIDRRRGFARNAAADCACACRGGRRRGRRRRRSRRRRRRPRRRRVQPRCCAGRAAAGTPRTPAARIAVRRQPAPDAGRGVRARRRGAAGVAARAAGLGGPPQPPRAALRRGGRRRGGRRGGVWMVAAAAGRAGGGAGRRRRLPRPRPAQRRTHQRLCAGPGCVLVDARARRQHLSMGSL